MKQKYFSLHTIQFKLVTFVFYIIARSRAGKFEPISICRIVNINYHIM